MRLQGPRYADLQQGRGGPTSYCSQDKLSGTPLNSTPLHPCSGMAPLSSTVPWSHTLETNVLKEQSAVELLGMGSRGRDFLPDLRYLYRNVWKDVPYPILCRRGHETLPRAYPTVAQSLFNTQQSNLRPIVPCGPWSHHNPKRIILISQMTSAMNSKPEIIQGGEECKSTSD